MGRRKADKPQVPPEGTSETGRSPDIQRASWGKEIKLLRVYNLEVLVSSVYFQGKQNYFKTVVDKLGHRSFSAQP